MPAKSKSQQRAAGMALSAKRGEMSPDDLKGAAKDMYDSMSEKQLRDFAKTSTKDLPTKKIHEDDFVGQIAALIEDPVQEATLEIRPDPKEPKEDMAVWTDRPKGHKFTWEKKKAAKKKSTPDDIAEALD